MLLLVDILLIVFLAAIIAIGAQYIKNWLEGNWEDRDPPPTGST